MHNQNVHGFPPNIDPQLFAWLACVVGSACVGDYTANEQNSFGNWLILVGQFVLTTAAQQTLIEARLESNNININSREHKNGGSFYANSSKSNQTQREEVDFLLSAVDNIRQELEKLKKE